MAEEVLNRSSPNGISVLISGAGVGGLMTALECWRRGCNVRILERTKYNVTSGDSFSIGPTAIGLFRNWPEMQKDCERIAQKPLLVYCDHTGKRFTKPMELEDLMPKELVDAGMRIYRHSRPKFHKMLLDQLGRIGVAVEYECEVVEYFEDVSRAVAGVVLKDGSRHEADLAIAADGVRGASRSLVQGHEIPARSSGDAIFRIAYPVELALADPMVADRFQMSEEGRSTAEFWVG